MFEGPEDRLESVYANRVKNGRIVQSPEKFLDDNLPLLNDYEEYRAYQTLENVEVLLLPFEDASSPDGLVKRFFRLIGHNEVVPKELGRNKRLSPIMLELIRNRTGDVDFSSKKYAEFRRVTNSFVDDDKNLAIFGPDSKRRISEYYQADYEKLLRLLPNSTNGETHNYLTKPSLVYRERLKSATLPHSEVFRLLWSLWGVLWDENKRLKVEIRSLKENSRNQ